MSTKTCADTALNREWEKRALDGGADFVRFVDLAGLSPDVTAGYRRALLFGKALSKAYIAAVAADLPPKTKEVLNVERKMDTLADQLAEALNAAGYESVAKLKTGRFPHKTAALRAGLGFIGKNNLLVTERYGCAVMLGKVLTNAPFSAVSQEPATPSCGDCRVCVDHCPTGALLGTAWTLRTTRDEILTRKRCTLCVRCMACCPYTRRYAGDAP